MPRFIVSGIRVLNMYAIVEAPNEASAWMVPDSHIFWMESDDQALQVEMEQVEVIEDGTC